MKIKGMSNVFILELCKMNGKKIGIIPSHYVRSITKGIEKVSEFSFIIKKYYGKNDNGNILYNEIKEERLVNINKDECYVIKNIKEINETEKEVTLYSKEKKLYKNNVDGIEDVSLTLLTPYKDIEDCYCLNDILYEQTGWRLGYISDYVLYKAEETTLDILNESKNYKLTTDEKLRYQESVNTNWYDFIMNDISEQFECHPIFDSYNMLINLYSDDELGGNLNLILTYDNYLKSVEKNTTTDDIVTRLTLEGNSELNILDVNPTGLRYIEDYTYFIDNEEMSDELILALKKYEYIVDIRSKQWYTLKLEKESKAKILYSKQIELKILYSKLQSLKTVIDITKDESYRAELVDQLTKLEDDEALLKLDITTLDSEVKLLIESIDNINKLCKKEYATDENGILIFNEYLIDELKNFIYQDVYSNDCITEDNILLKIGKKKLKELSVPTKSWTIDSINFMEKLIDNGFRQHWNGEIGLGDMIMIKGNEYNEVIYLVEYTQNLENKTLQLVLSNKKTNKDFSLSIGERLTQSKEAFRKIKKEQYIFTEIKNNRLGLNYDKINKEIL